VTVPQLAFWALIGIAALVNLDLVLLWLTCLVAEFRGRAYDGNKLLAWTVAAAALDVAVIVVGTVVL
jgi:hypothetical protein